MWIERLLLKFKISANEKVLIYDELGLFSFQPVRDYLVNNGFKIRDISALAKLSSLSKANEVGLFIYPEKNIPRIIRERFHYIEINQNNIPFDIAPEVYDKVSFLDLSLIFSEIDSKNIQSQITLANYKDILYNSKKQSYLEKRVKVIDKIENMFVSDFDYNSILLVGKLLGELNYHDYLYDINNYKLPDYMIDKLENYIISDHYNSVFYESEHSVKTVEKIIPYLKTVDQTKIALLCFDCMGFTEWLILKDYLRKYTVNEMAVLALIPTITSISRKAIFAGNFNVYDTIQSDEKLFMNNFGDESSVAFYANKDEVSNDNIFGYENICKVFNLFDDLAHGILVTDKLASKRTYFNQIKEYLENSNILNTIDILVNDNFRVFFCSDHGSTIAEGSGVRFEKWIKEISGKRAFITSDPQHIDPENVIIYKAPFTDKSVVIAKKNSMFDHKNAKGIVHGGISLEELVVPFIEIKGRKIDDRI